MCDLEPYLTVLLVTLSKVTPELGRAVLVGVDDPFAKGPELGRDNFEEVLEHVVVLRGLGKGTSQSEREGPEYRYRRTYHPFGVVQRMVDDSHLCHQYFCHGGFTFVVLIVRGKLQMVDGVTEVMSNSLFLQVWDQIVYVLVVRRLEGATRGEVDVASDLVDTETARDVATFMGLIL